MKTFQKKEKKKNYSFSLKELPSIMKRVDKLAKFYNINRSEFISTVIELALNKYEHKTKSKK